MKSLIYYFGNLSIDDRESDLSIKEAGRTREENRL